MPKLVTIAKYAKLDKTSEPNIRKKITRGTITVVHEPRTLMMIDVEQYPPKKRKSKKGKTSKNNTNY